MSAAFATCYIRGNMEDTEWQGLAWCQERAKVVWIHAHVALNAVFHTAASRRQRTVRFMPSASPRSTAHTIYVVENATPFHLREAYFSSPGTILHASSNCTKFKTFFIPVLPSWAVRRFPAEMQKRSHMRTKPTPTYALAPQVCMTSPSRINNYCGAASIWQALAQKKDRH